MQGLVVCDRRDDDRREPGPSNTRAKETTTILARGDINNFANQGRRTAIDWFCITQG
jgi:hypothetical protein